MSLIFYWLILPLKAFQITELIFLGLDILLFFLFILEIKPCGLGSKIRDVEVFWYKTEIKIIYFVPLCLIVLIVSDCMVYPDPKLNIKKCTWDQSLKSILIAFSF